MTELTISQETKIRRLAKGHSKCPMDAESRKMTGPSARWWGQKSPSPERNSEGRVT